MWSLIRASLVRRWTEIRWKVLERIFSNRFVCYLINLLLLLATTNQWKTFFNIFLLFATFVCLFRCYFFRVVCYTLLLLCCVVLYVFVYACVRICVPVFNRFFLPFFSHSLYLYLLQYYPIFLTKVFGFVFANFAMNLWTNSILCVRSLVDGSLSFCQCECVRC